MTAISWLKPVERLFNQGVDRGVLYFRDQVAKPWNGLIQVTETSETIENAGYFDGIPYRQRVKTGVWSADVDAYTYPDEFDNQVKAIFGFSYRTQQSDGSYLIHLVYNAIAKSGDKAYRTKDTAIELTPFKWQLSTKPLNMSNGLFGSHLVVELRDTNNPAVLELETLLYGSSETDGYLPSPLEVLDVFERNAVVRVINNGDGTATISGPSEAIVSNGDGTTTITWPTVVYISENSVRITSM